MALQRGIRIHQYLDHAVQCGVPGPAIHVPHRSSNNIRKTNPPRSAIYEAHILALEEQLEGPRITRKGNTRLQVAPPSLKMVAGGKQCASRSNITPTKACSVDLYRRIKRKVGGSLKQTHCKGNLIHSRKQAHKNHQELKAVFLALKEFQNNIVLVANGNTTVVVYINKEVGMKSGPLCDLVYQE